MIFQSPLDRLATYHELVGLNGMGDERRSQAFFKASAALRCLPFKVVAPSHLEGIKDIGSGHCLKVIEEILSHGTSEEVQRKLAEKRFQAVEVSDCLNP